jgi:ABC-type glycerol-3-phosphate transport system permease component
MRNTKTAWSRVALHTVLIIASLIAAYPVFIMISGSFKTLKELFANSTGLPIEPTVNNFRRLFGLNSGIIVRTYLNSVGIAAVSTALTLVAASMAGFAFSKYRFRGRNILFLMLLITMMVPAEVNITPLFLIFSKLKWLSTYQVQIIPSIANVFAMFMFRQYMDSVPDSLIEAARIDGAGHFRVYRSIILPVSVPTLGALAILLFLGKWNDYLFPRIMVDKIAFKPIMLILPTLNETDNSASVPWDLLLTGCTIVTIPLIAMFLCFQDKFLSSVTIGSVKG